MICQDDSNLAGTFPERLDFVAGCIELFNPGTF
jgi:hypothetical protein